MKIIDRIKTKEEARQIAIDWQNTISNKSISYAELARRQKYFRFIAEKFNLTEEFKENGIL